MSASERRTPPRSQAGDSATNAARARLSDDATTGLPPAGGAMTRGFLFADLRGYTSFVESRGEVALMLAVLEVQDPADFDEFAAEAHEVITTFVFADGQ